MVDAGRPSRLQLAVGQIELLLVHNPVMERAVTLGKGDPFSFDGVGQDECRAASVGFGFVEGVEDLPEVVTIDFDHEPAKGAPFIAQWFGRGAFWSGPMACSLFRSRIAITWSRRWKAANMAASQDLAFVDFAIAQDHIRPGRRSHPA